MMQERAGAPVDLQLLLKQAAQYIFEGIELPAGKAANDTDDDPLDLLSVALILNKRKVRKLLRTTGWMFYGWYGVEMGTARLYQGKPRVPDEEVRVIFSYLIDIVGQLMGLTCPMCTTALFLIAGLYWARYDTDRSGSETPRKVWEWMSSPMTSKMQAQGDGYDIIADVQNILRNKPKEDGHAPA